MRHVALATLLLSSPALAQVSYEAGTPGDPDEAPAPTTQGWSETITGSGSVFDVSPDPDFPLNAWQLNDTGDGRVRYHQDFYPGQSEYIVEVVMRPLADSMYLLIDAGDLITDNIFELELRVSGPDVRVVSVWGDTLLCPGGADGYHTYHFHSGYAWNGALVYYDGQYIGDMPYTDWGLGVWGEGLTWGTPDSGAGRARVHHVSMGKLEPGPIGENYCVANPHSGGIPARMEAFGLDLPWENDVRLDAVDLPPNELGYFLVSETQLFVPMPGGSQGILCLGGAIGRYTDNVLSTGADGAFSLQIDLTALPTVPPQSVMWGETWNFQAWFRDKNPTQTSNFTDGISIEF